MMRFGFVLMLASSLGCSAGNQCVAHSNCPTGTRCIDGLCVAPSDAGRAEAGPDSGLVDSGLVEAGRADVGSDSGLVDSGLVEAGRADVGGDVGPALDGGSLDGGRRDIAAPADGGTGDLGSPIDGGAVADVP